MDEHEAAELPQSVHALLSRSETWAVPPPELEDRVLTSLRRERDGAASDIGTASDFGAARERRAAKTRRGSRVFAAAAAVAAVAIGAGVVYSQSRQPEPQSVVALSATELAPGAYGRAELRSTPSGFEIELDIDGLEPAPAGTYYQAWVKNAAGALVTIGTFHGRSGSDNIVLWSGVDPAAYPTITVTLQSEGSGPASSGKVVLRGTAQ